MSNKDNNATESARNIKAVYEYRTFRCVVVFIELIKQNMPNMLLCHFHYNFEKITVKIELHSRFETYITTYILHLLTCAE